MQPGDKLFLWWEWEDGDVTDYDASAHWTECNGEAPADDNICDILTANGYGGPIYDDTWDAYYGLQIFDVSADATEDDEVEIKFTAGTE